MKDTIKDKLILAGVRNLQEFGYKHCTTENILTDTMCRALFVSMLRSNRGQAGKEVDAAIDELLSLCGIEEKKSAGVVQPKKARRSRKEENT